MSDYEIKDSGEHREFMSGAKRDKKHGKGRYDLLPPFTIHDLAVHWQKGAKKYDARNWEKGIPISEYIDSCKRHINEYEMGLEDENHLIAACWNLMCAYETLKRIKLGILPRELDDLPRYLAKKRVTTKNTYIGKECKLNKGNSLIKVEEPNLHNISLG